MLLLGDPRAFWFDIVQIRTLISYLFQNFAPFSKSGLTFRWSFYSGGLGGMVCLFILFSPSLPFSTVVPSVKEEQINGQSPNFLLPWDCCIQVADIPCMVSLYVGIFILVICVWPESTFVLHLPLMNICGSPKFM